MPSHTKPFSSNILKVSWIEALKTQANTRIPVKQFLPKNINNGQPSAKTVILVEKQKAPSRLRVKRKGGLKETHVLKRKGEVNDASPSTQLKAMSGLVPKTTDRLGQYSYSSSRKKRASYDSEEDNTGAKFSTRKLGFSKDTVSKDSCMIQGNKRQDGIAINKEKIIEFGEYHKKGDTTKAKRTLGSTLSDIRDNHSMYLTIDDVEKRGFIERNMGQFANCNNTYMSKKRKEPLSEENPKAPNDNESNVGVQSDNLSCKQMKKLRQSIVTRKDEVEDGVGDHVGVDDDTSSILKNDHAKVLVSSCVEQQCYSCSKPIDKPSWSGIFKIDDKEYVSLDGHLSTKSCDKAWSLSRQLLQVVEVKKLSRLEVWPKAWEASAPNGDDIGIYFFPHEMRQDEGVDQLVREVMENNLALQIIIGEAEMLIFPSILLPIHHQTFQRKHYLWGVFKRREYKGAVVDKPLNAMGHCDKEKQQKVVSNQPNNHMLVVEKPNQEMSRMAGVVPLERQMLHVNERTQEVEASFLEGPTNNKGFDLKAPGEERGHAQATLVANDAAAFPASHGQINPSMGNTASKLIGFVLQRTPKLDRIIQEIEREGALVFAMQGEMFGDGAWGGSKATATQK